MPNLFGPSNSAESYSVWTLLLLDVLVAVLGGDCAGRIYWWQQELAHLSRLCRPIPPEKGETGPLLPIHATQNWVNV